MNKEQLLEKARTLPMSPGVYLIKSKSGKVIYVGKSKVLKNRVSSYFAPGDHPYPKTNRMLQSVHDFEVYFTKTELEALLLENQFIKQHSPRYNVKLKDSLSYPYIRVTNEPYPKITFCHRRSNDKDRYFGPFSSVGVAKNIVETVNKTFLLPTCNRKFPEEIGKERPCLSYHINQCIAPCIPGAITLEEYNALVEEALDFLKGDYSSLTRSLEDKMHTAAEDQLYEQAGRYRDRIKAVKAIGDKQQIVAPPDVEADIFGYYEDDLGSAITVLFVRRGAIIDRETFFFNADEIFDSGAIITFMSRFYQLRRFVPRRIYTNYEVLSEDRDLIISWLHSEAGYSVDLKIPQKGRMRALAETAKDNAKQLLLLNRAKQERQNDFLVSLSGFLRLEIIPERIEAYDVSNNGVEDTTCGMIVLKNGRFAKRHYRSFNIKGVQGMDDYGALREALNRRFSHKTDEPGWEYPDLIFMDGGVGQVSVANQVLQNHGLSIPVFGMVKDEYHKTRTLIDDQGQLSLNKRQDIFVFVYKIQEEVHRYALARMDIRRRKTVKKSFLTEIKGIGPSKAKALLEHFGTLENLKAATVTDIEKVKGIPAKLAVDIYNFLRDD